jgi:hypothetical protein
LARIPGPADHRHRDWPARPRRYGPGRQEPGRPRDRTQIAALGIRLLRPDRRDEPARHGNLGGVRQWIEWVYDSLKGQLGLERHGGRTPHGVFTRIAQRLLALAAAIWHNWAAGAPGKRCLTTYDH